MRRFWLTFALCAALALGGECRAQTLGVGSASTLASAGIVLKAKAGNLYAVLITNPSVAGYGMVFDSPTLPGNGAVTAAALKLCFVVDTINTTSPSTQPIVLAWPLAFKTGIAVAFSTTGCSTYTSSATAFIMGAFQ